MVDVRGILKQAKPGGQNQQIAPINQVAVSQNVEKKTVEIEKQVAVEEVTSGYRETTVRTTTAAERSTSKARFVKRPDLPQEVYRERPDTSTYQIYNDDVNEFMKTFSRKNSQHRGGAKITPSMLIEALADVAYYDLEIRPDGFTSLEEVREFIRSKLK